MPKPITRFFSDDLQAPLSNTVWSWGADTPDGRIFLRVWAKDYRHAEKRVIVLAPDWNPSTAGFRERVRHIEAIEAGEAAYMVVCDGHYDEEEGKMVIDSFRDDVVFPIRKIERVVGTVYAHFDRPVAVKHLHAQAQVVACIH